MQIIPAAKRGPSTGERFAQAFSNAGRQASQSIGEYQQQKENSFQEQMKKDFEMEKLEKQFQNQLNLQKEKYSFEKELMNGKPDKKIEDEQKSKDIAQNAFNTIIDITKKGNVGKGSGFLEMFGGETSKDVGEFKSTLGGLEQALTHLVTTGVLSDAKFNYIKNDLLPSPYDTQATIKGKMEGISKILGLKNKDNEESNEIIEMRDSEGRIYDIPQHLRETAIRKGLM